MSKLKIPAGFTDVTPQMRGTVIAIIGDHVRAGGTGGRINETNLHCTDGHDEHRVAYHEAGHAVGRMIGNCKECDGTGRRRCDVCGGTGEVEPANTK